MRLVHGRAGEASMGDDASERHLDRRQSERHLACFPAHVRAGEEEKAEPDIALIRDLSVTGALILTHQKVPVGARLDLSLYIVTSDDAREARGRVIRSERRPLK